MIAAQKLADEKWAKEAFSMSNVTSSSSNDSSSGINGAGNSAVGVPVQVELSVTGEAIPPPAVSAATAAAAATTAAANAAAYAVAAEAEKLKRDKENKEKDALERLKAKAASGLATVDGGAPPGGWMSSWFGPSKEQKQAKAEFDKWQKQFNERSSSGPVSLPPEVPYHYHCHLDHLYPLYHCHICHCHLYSHYCHHPLPFSHPYFHPILTHLPLSPPRKVPTTVTKSLTTITPTQIPYLCHPHSVPAQCMGLSGAVRLPVPARFISPHGSLGHRIQGNTHIHTHSHSHTHLATHIHTHTHTFTHTHIHT